jgi:MoaA/NifB/PqqE/SkfB family radical SAM enzyme
MSEIKVLHLEPTNVCNLACPSCLRETDKTFNKKSKDHLSVEQIKTLIDENVIRNLDKMFMCGLLGDPAAAIHSIEIYEYFRLINPTIQLGMNTSGSLRNSDYWKYLGEKIFNRDGDYILFSIDGLKDTNHIYRVNADWDKIINNSTSFIEAGGKAQWDMLVYAHNEHQVDEAEELARQMKFTHFRAKVSKRIPTVDWLAPPINWKRTTVAEGSIECFADKEKSLYISATGKLYKCCWLGQESHNTLEKFEDIKKTWNTVNCYPICKDTCTKQNNLTQFTNQWLRDTPL